MRNKRLGCSSKMLTCILLSLILTVTMGITAGAAVNNENVFPVESNQWTNWPQAADIEASTGIVMDAKSGTILFNKGMDDQRYPASITKIMTALLAIENSALDAQVTFTETGMADAYSGSSNIQPKLGETFTMEQCLYMIMLKSANDVSTQVAEQIGGTVPAFVDMMNQRAQELGCTNTHFNNANGLPDENHYTSAHDMALIAQEALKNEIFCKIVATTNYVVPPTNLSTGSREYRNHHALMFEEDTTWYYDGCFGGKTGYTDSSKNTLVTFAERDGMKLITVVMHGTSGPSVCTDTRNMMDYAYTNFKCNSTGELTTLTGAPIVDNMIQEKSDIQKSQITAVPTPKNEIAESQEYKTKEKTSSIENSLTAYVIIGILSSLVVVGIIAIFVGLAKKKQRNQK